MLKLIANGGVQFRFVQRVKFCFWQEKKEIHYIGGTEVLPPPLSPEEEKKIAKRQIKMFNLMVIRKMQIKYHFSNICLERF